MLPFEQVVPEATFCHTTLPWSQRPKVSEPLQTISPSVVHVVELPVAPLYEDEEPVGEAVEPPEDGPETPSPIDGDRVG